MKSPKKSSRESFLPSQDESRRTNVLLEKLMSEFRIFGEGQADLRGRVGNIETDLHSVKEDVAILKSAALTHTQEIRVLNEVVQGIRVDLATISRRLEVVEMKAL